MNAVGDDPAAVLRRPTGGAKSQAELNVSIFADLARKADAQERAQRRTNRRKRCDDPVLGSLRFDVLWEGKVDLPPFGTGLDLLVDNEDDEGSTTLPPTERQREAFRQFAADATAMRDFAERASFDYYNSVKVQFRQFLRESAVERVPELAAAADIWRLLEGPPSVIVGPDVEGEPVPITLGYGCSWDVEHGHHVRFEDDKVTDVGSL